MDKPFYYGGQALIEGVMIRGRKAVAVAVRRPAGDIVCITMPLSPLFTGTWRRVPLVRGVIVLIETLSVGMRALMYSANVAIEGEAKKHGEEQPPAWYLWTTMAIALSIGIAVFFLVPLFLSKVTESYVSSSIANNAIEGVIRLVMFVAYLWLVGRAPDIKRVFAYHGAEHMAIHAHEHQRPLEVAEVRRFPTAHPRCGTAFLLLVLVVAVVVFPFLGRPSLPLLVLSRILLVPVIAAISYELLRFNAAHIGSILVKPVVAPGLVLQRLTTRQPKDDQIEVAISALKTALADDASETLAPRPAVDHA